MTVIPPIKSQGIKTKLVHWIKGCSEGVTYDRWVEPFMGTGSGKAIKQFCAVSEGKKLLDTKGDHYYKIRERFNVEGNPLDFLFLSRSCFNGMMQGERRYSLHRRVQVNSRLHWAACGYLNQAKKQNS